MKCKHENKPCAKCNYCGDNENRPSGTYDSSKIIKGITSNPNF